MTQLFDATNLGILAPHTVAGFDRPIPAICYRGDQLKSPFPMGGIATGYLELRGDGKTGLSSIYNSYVPMMATSATLLSLVGEDGNVVPLDAEHAEIAVLAHFPVCNVRFAVKEGPLVWLRVFGTILPGDSDGSNTPGVVLEVTTEGNFPGRVRIDLALGHHVEPIVKPLDLPPELRGSGRKYFKRDDYRGSFVLAWIDGDEGNGEVAADKAHFSLTGLIKPGKTRRAVFAWHVPWWIDTGLEPHMNRYASRFPDALSVAQHLAKQHASILKRTIGWQSAVYQSGEPDWVVNALVQSLYSHVKNTLWVDEQRPDRWYEPNGLFIHSESFRGCPINETMVCRQHGHLPHVLLWPDLERSTLAAFAHFQLRDGEVPFSFGQPNSLRDPRYHCQHPLNSAQFIQQVQRYFVRTSDEKFLRRLWPNLIDAMRYMAELDHDEDSLVNEHPHALRGENWPANQFYDQWPWQGTSAYVAGTGLAALRAVASLADHLGENDVHAEAMGRLQKGSNSFRKKLWNGSYFRLWSDEKLGGNETCLANQLMGQWCVRIVDDEPLFTDDECRSVFAAIEEHNAAPTRFGLINGGNFQGDAGVAGDPNNNHGTMIFIGENLCAAMTGMYEGHAGAEGWARRMVWAIHEHQGMPFDQHCLIRHDNGAPAWGNDYYSNLVVWALPMARGRIGIKQSVAAGSMIDRMLQASKRSET
ncbi:MAG TPA: GH116 family glycosyl hydrolase [Tepidisphaeraceae bacterium]|nr:GH116 family glycosyl hydrolase [Tepidisphaeraceae bacterium]